jgi:hypothetical protein
MCERVAKTREKFEPLIDACKVGLKIRRESLTNTFVVMPQPNMLIGDGRSVAALLSFLGEPNPGEIIDRAVDVKHKALDIDRRVRKLVRGRMLLL